MRRLAVSRAPRLGIVCTLVVAAAALMPASDARSQAQTASPAAPAAGAAPARGGVAIEPIAHDDRTGWTSIFDGKTLAGWDGNPAVWTAKDGMLVGTSLPDRRVATSFLIWQGGELEDFELKFEIQLTGDIHSGITYRGRVGPAPAAGQAGRAAGAAPPGAATAGTVAATGAAANTAAGATTGRGAGAGQVAGATAPAAGRAPQAPVSIPADPRWTMSGIGMDYDATTAALGNMENRGGGGRRLGVRGSIVESRPGVPPRTIGSLGDPAALLQMVKPLEWTRVHIIARGRQYMHILNGQVMLIAIDHDPELFVPSGRLGLQVEGPYGAGEVRVRNVWLRR